MYLRNGWDLYTLSFPSSILYLIIQFSGTLVGRDGAGYASNTGTEDTAHAGMHATFLSSVASILKMSV